jgi:two-component system LytT family sensor kinase
MKKRTLALSGLLLFIISLFSAGAIAQQQYIEPPFGNNILFNFNGSRFGVPDYQLYMAEHYGAAAPNNKRDDLLAKRSILLGVKLDANLKYFHGQQITSVSKLYPSYIISNGTAAELLAFGINKDNITDYHYRVIMNDSVTVVPWSPIPKLATEHNAMRPYGFIGNFCKPGSQLLVEVENIKDYNIRDGVLFDWRTDFIPVVNGLSVTDKAMYGIDLLNTKTNKGYATRFNPVTGLPTDLKIPVDSIIGISISFKHHETFTFDAYLVRPGDKKPDTLNYGTQLSENYLNVNPDVLQKPGKYIIIIKNTINRGGGERSLKIPFQIIAPPEKKAAISLKQSLPYIAATLTGVALVFGIYYRRNQLKLAHAAREKQMAGLKLQSIRAQLNPHFMFNALTSIQNLINKHDMAAANHYLSKFAGLTRQVLDTGNEELLSLEQEVAILDDYLQMEQLRFGFNYEIIVDHSINRANTDIPAMLLQPFVENAVKHGVAILKTAGKIEVTIISDVKDIIFTVKDNGKWITNDEASGYGLKLTRERIDLLNQLYKDQPLNLHIDKHKEGTTVSIRLLNWL